MLHTGEIYHIYNHANGSDNLFLEDRNYNYFLDKVIIHLLPVAEIYAYCLMPNHFHLVTGIRETKEIETRLNLRIVTVGLDVEERKLFVEKKISKAFSNLFSSYTQSFNKLYNRKGSLFMPNFKNNLIEGDLEFCKIVHYTHANPVHHGFVRALDEWKYSSYKSMLSFKNTNLERKYVLDRFDGVKGFQDYHTQPIDLKMKWANE